MSPHLEARAAGMRSKYERGRHKLAVLEALRAAPATAFEMSVVTGLSARICGSWLAFFNGQGFAEITGYRRIGNRRVGIYALKGSC